MLLRQKKNPKLMRVSVGGSGTVTVPKCLLKNDNDKKGTYTHTHTHVTQQPSEVCPGPGAQEA